MTINIPVSIVFCLFSFTAFAQRKCSIKGSVVDTSSKVTLVNTTVCVLNAKDSILRKFVYAGENGSFVINDFAPGKYILFMSYTNYADYSEHFTLDTESPTHNFGAVIMRLKSKILQEVIVKGKVTAIRIKGDTTEFNAKAYVIQPNDKVEDLIRQLPSIEVDKDGKITANGKTVSKVLVDGDEFFGDDPTLVTRNIRADMVDKIQLYDKKSDQATFTGIDDGKKTTTINVVLKQDKRTGEFGKITGGIGTDDYYNSQIMYNRFKDNEKYAAYFNLVNDGITPIGGGSNDAINSFSGAYSGQGMPLERDGGVHYSGKLDGDKATINTDYKISSLEINGNTATTTQQSLPSSVNGILNANSNQTFDNYTLMQKLEVAYTLNLDTSSNLKINADGTQKRFKVDNNYQTAVFGNDNNIVNQQNRSITNSGDQQIFNANIFYTKKFRKPRRTFSWNLSQLYTNNNTQGYLNSVTDFFNKSGVKDSAQIVNQYKTTRTVGAVLNSNMTYTEPLSKALSLILNYSFDINSSIQDIKSFDQSAPKIYDILDAAYSNDYRFNQLTNQFGAFFNYQKKKITFNWGTKTSYANFNQADENKDMVYRRDFINWNPQAILIYSKSQSESFTFNYNGNTTQPTINQIQPVLVNTDPQNVIVGNAYLKASFTNSLSLTYGSFKPLSGSYLSILGSFSSTADQIINNTYTNPLTSKTTTQYINLNAKTPYEYNVSFNESRRFSPLDFMAGLSLNTSCNIGYSYVNNEINQSKTYTYNLSANLTKYVAKQYLLNLHAGPSYMISEFSLDPGNNNNAVGFNGDGNGSYYFPGKFFISTDINYTYTGKTEAFTAQYRTIWNASVNKTFLKGDKLKLSLAVNDLLNQNINFNRSVSGNTITQTSTNGIKRYLMFSITWDFNKFGVEPAKK